MTLTRGIVPPRGNRAHPVCAAIRDRWTGRRRTDPAHADSCRSGRGGERVYLPRGSSENRPRGGAPFPLATRTRTARAHPARAWARGARNSVRARPRAQADRRRGGVAPRGGALGRPLGRLLAGVPHVARAAAAVPVERTRRPAIRAARQSGATPCIEPLRRGLAPCDSTLRDHAQARGGVRQALWRSPFLRPHRRTREHCGASSGAERRGAARLLHGGVPHGVPRELRRAARCAGGAARGAGVPRCLAYVARRRTSVRTPVGRADEGPRLRGRGRAAGGGRPRGPALPATALRKCAPRLRRAQLADQAGDLPRHRAAHPLPRAEGVGGRAPADRARCCHRRRLQVSRRCLRVARARARAGDLDRRERSRSCAAGVLRWQRTGALPLGTRRSGVGLSTAEHLSSDQVKSRAATGVAVILGRGVAFQLLGFLGNLVLARLLLPKDFGLVAIGFTVVNLGRFLAVGGLGYAIVGRAEAPDRRELRAIAGLQLLVTSAISGVATAGWRSGGGAAPGPP